MRSVQDSVLPRGVGLRKPHIFSLPSSSSLLTSFSSLLSPYFLLFPAAQPLTRTAHGVRGGDLLLTGEGGMVYSFCRITLNMYVVYVGRVMAQEMDYAQVNG